MCCFSVYCMCLCISGEGLLMWVCRVVSVLVEDGVLFSVMVMLCS